jgi:hypothetical protein
MNRYRDKPSSKPVVRGRATSTLVELTSVPAERLAAAEREAVLDQILTDLWKGQLTRDAAVGRIMAKLGLGQRAAQDEVDGFLRD